MLSTRENVKMVWKLSWVVLRSRSKVAPVRRYNNAILTIRESMNVETLNAF